MPDGWMPEKMRCMAVFSAAAGGSSRGMPAAAAGAGRNSPTSNAPSACPASP